MFTRTGVPLVLFTHIIMMSTRTGSPFVQQVHECPGIQHFIVYFSVLGTTLSPLLVINYGKLLDITCNVPGVLTYNYTWTRHCYKFLGIA